jgi:hypothetical protein
MRPRIALIISGQHLAQLDGEGAPGSNIYKRTGCASLAGIQPRKLFGNAA